MCKEAGITEQKTNHSLRATGTSAVFNATVHEKMIRDVTGHRSKALQLYEWPSVDKQKAVSTVLMSNKENIECQQLGEVDCNPINSGCRLYQIQWEHFFRIRWLHDF